MIHEQGMGEWGTAVDRQTHTHTLIHTHTHMHMHTSTHTHTHTHTYTHSTAVMTHCKYQNGCFYV